MPILGESWGSSRAPWGQRRRSQDERDQPRAATAPFLYVPEQVRGKDLDGRTDLFSFGIVLYEMATGKMALPWETAGVVFDRS